MVSSSKVHNLFVWTEMWENKTKDKWQFLVSFIMFFYRFNGKIWMKMKCFNDSKLLNVEKFCDLQVFVCGLEICNPQTNTWKSLSY